MIEPVQEQSTSVALMQAGKRVGHNKKIALLNVYEPRWMEFVQGRSEASPFHHPAWSSVLAECYGYSPMALALTDESGGVTAGTPVMDVRRRLTDRRWVSLPFTDYCPPLVEERLAGELADALVAETESWGVRRLEVRSALPEHANLHAHVSGVRHTLALDAEAESIYARFSKMHRRNIRKAERLGVSVAVGHSMSDVDMFYRLHLLTRRRQGVPIQPRRFFTLLAQRVIQAGLGFVLTARVDQVPVASAIFLCWNGTLIYKFGASDARYWDYRPNNLLFREAIRWGIGHDFHTLDWGRTDLEDRGLREFKAGWGAVEEPLLYSSNGASVASGVSSGRLMKVLSTVIRRSPPVVCRVTGELLYGYTA